MARYDYECECGNRFEAIHSFFHEEPVGCPECGSDNTHKIFTGCAGITFNWHRLGFDDGALNHAGKNRYKPAVKNTLMRP